VGFDVRRGALLGALENVASTRDLAQLPPNDLASSPLADELRAEGAFRADVSGAGPTLYGLFHSTDDARRAERRLKRLGRTISTVPAWYG
jgi:4-diphosphocytidyl-2C-methyl-D-erythritol kinase